MRRNIKQIETDILELLLYNGLSMLPTQLMEKSNLNSKKLDIILNKLELSGLVRKDLTTKTYSNKRRHTTIVLTNRGIDFYIRMEKIRERLYGKD